MVGRGGDVAPAGLAHQADGEVAQGSHGSGCVAGADLGGVLGVGHVSDVVQGFHGPVALDEFGEPGGGHLAGSEAGDGVDGLRLELAGLGIDATALDLDLDGLGGVREEQSGLDGADLEASYFALSMPGGAGAVQQRDLFPGQAAQLPAELLLVGLDGQDVVPVGRDDLLRGLALGVHRIGGDDRAAQVEAGQQRCHGGNFVALGRDLALGDNGLGVVEGGGQQMDRGRVLGA